MKLTAREKEIVEALQKEPLISQDQLATHFGISRSSVAVHISNLMKKGIILGKGYVFSQQASVVVVGQVGLEIDIREVDGSSRIDLRHTGFGMETCRSLAQFGINPKLVTVIGNDELGHAILGELLELDTDINHVYRHPRQRTGRWVRSESGLRATESYTPQEFAPALNARDWLVSDCDYLLVEPEYTQQVVGQISPRPGSSPCLCGHWYAREPRPASLDYWGLVVMGVDGFQDYDLYIRLAQQMLEAGTQDCIITDGTSNMVLVNSDGVRDFPLLPSQVFAVRDRLQVFLAGLVYGLAAHYPLRQAIRIAAGAAHGSGDRVIP